MESTVTYDNGIKGYVKPGFEHVLDEFEQLFIDGHDKRSQICIFVGDEMVVDLYRGVTPQSITTIYSSGKNVAPILMATLHDKGLFQYDDPVSKHWPEFAQNGKEAITIQDVLRHEGGLARLDQTEPFHLGSIGTEGVKKNVIGKVIEQTAPFWPKSTRREYHSVSKDWITNEIFRRVEPQGRTMGEYIRQEIWPLLEVKNLLISANENELADYVDHETYGGWKTFKDMWVGPKNAYTFSPLGKVTKYFGEMTAAMNERDKEMKAAGLTGKDDFRMSSKEETCPEFYDQVGDLQTCWKTRKVVTAEMLSAGMATSARTLAKLGAFMANKGQFQGKVLMQPEAWESMHSDPKRQDLGAGGGYSNFTRGGVNSFQLNDKTNRTEFQILFDVQTSEGREGYYGWHGFGGSVFHWHPEKKISFAYVPFELNQMDFFNTRGKRLQVAVGKCVEGNNPRRAKKSTTCNVF